MDQPDAPERGGSSSLIPPHGGFGKLKTFQLAGLLHDVTARFCNKFVDRRSRTYDQMVQAARSGCQNIAEGSVDSATSKRSELKLTGIARGSLEELRLDYEDFLRQHGLPQWPPDHPALVRFKARRCATLDDFRAWVAAEVQLARKPPEKPAANTDQHRPTPTNTDHAAPASVSVCEGQCESVSLPDLPAVLAANGALSLLNLCLYLLNRQLEAQAAAFARDGGFTERLYRERRAPRVPRKRP